MTPPNTTPASPTTVIDRCRETVASLAQATLWISENSERLGQELPGLVKEFRKHSNVARLLERSAGRRMCVGVFGPSQSGKSYLISALARKGADPLIARFGAREVDFVREINPEGGKESTGIVTRFTLATQRTPEGFPVLLRLLSELDVVRILGNTFFLDCNHADLEAPSAEQILERIEEVRSDAGSDPVDGCTEDGFYALQEYFEQRFRASTGYERVRRLNHTFWAEAVTLGPRLPFDKRTRLMSMLWGDVASYTNLYQRLFRALRALGFASEVYASIDALLPRETSIIDVAMLTGLDQQGGGSRLSLRTPAGIEATLDRAEVAALTAELVISMRDRPWPFFDHTDLLDFPGARSRKLIPNLESHLEESGTQEPFLRGKVAYLFDRYCEERELTSMLLCIADSVQEVVSLPTMVHEWIESTHGSSLLDRDRQRNALFLVLTKFDRQLEEKAGADSSASTRWSTRIESSLLKFFGAQHDWPMKWNSAGAFRNSYWMRNPNFIFEAIFDYEGNGEARREIGIREIKRGYLAELKGAFLSNQDVRRHFADPERAWNAAFELNDGGVGYLAENLAPVCDPSLKDQQIDGQLAALRAAVVRRLEPYFVSDNLDAEIEKKIAAWKTIISPAVAECIQAQRFGELLRELEIDESTLEDVFYRVASEPTVGVQVGASDVLGDLGIDLAPASDEARDQAGRFARAAVAEWIGKLNDLAELGWFQRYFKLSPAAAGQLVHELIAGAQCRRVSLVENIARLVREASRYERGPHQRAVLPVTLTCQTINAYVDLLGFDSVSLRSRPQAGRAPSQRFIFAPMAPVKDFPVLAEDSPPFELTFAVDWLSGLGRLMQETATAGGDSKVDPAQNRALGEVLHGLRDVP